MNNQSDQPNDPSQPEAPKPEPPKIFAIKKQGQSWTMNRLSFLEAASTMIAGATVGGPGLLAQAQSAGGATASKTSAKSIYAHEKGVKSLAISLDGKWLASGGEEGNLKLWSLPSGALEKSVTAAQSSLDALLFSKDGRLLIAGATSYSGDAIKLWKMPDLQTDRGFGESQSGSFPMHLALSQDGTSLASGGRDKQVRLWKLPDASLVTTSETDASASLLKVMFSADGKKLLTLNGSGRICVRSLPDLACKTLFGESMAAPSAGTAAKTDLKGAELELQAESGNADAQYQLGLDLAKGTSGTTNRLEAYKWLQLAVDNGHIRANFARHEVASSLTPAQVEEAVKLAKAFKIPPANDSNTKTSNPAGRLVCFTLVSDGQIIVAGGDTGSIALISGRTGRILKVFPAHSERVNALVASADGSWLASGSNDTDIKLWSLPQGVLQQTLAGHSQKVNALAMSPDGKLLASASDDKSIRLWSLPDGKEIMRLMDLEVNFKTTEGIQYKSVNASGQTVTYTLPCGSPVPAGAVCVCNCVPGSLAVPTGHAQNYSNTGVCSCDTICTCNKVCTCQSVCSCVSNVTRPSTYTIHYWHPN